MAAEGEQSTLHAVDPCQVDLGDGYLGDENGVDLGVVFEVL